MNIAPEDTFVTGKIIGRAGWSSDNRAMTFDWQCDHCGKRSPYPLDTILRRATKQCEHCCATNWIDTEA